MLYELRMTAGLTAGTVCNMEKKKKRLERIKKKWDYVHLEVRCRYGKSLLLSYSQVQFTVDAY